MRRVKAPDGHLRDITLGVERMSNGSYRIRKGWPGCDTAANRSGFGYGTINSALAAMIRVETRRLEDLRRAES